MDSRRTVTRARLETCVVSGMDRANEAVMRWGHDDCATWVADIIKDAFGYDPVAAFRGRYSTRRGAARVIGRDGLLPHLRKIARRRKWKRINPEWAQAGDVGLAWTSQPNGKIVLAAVICRARGWFVARNERGWTADKAANVAYCWSVLDDCHPCTRVSISRPSAPRIGERTSAVCHEPVSMFIGLTSLISSIGIPGAVASAIGGFIVTSTLSIGVSLLASTQQQQLGAGRYDSSLGDTSAVQSVQVLGREPIPAKQVIVGGAYVAGKMFFEATKAPYLTSGVMLNYGEISAIERMWVGNNELAFNGITFDSILAPLALEDQPNYKDYLRVCFRQGSDDQTRDALIANDFTNVETTFRQRGIATAVVRYHFGGTDNSAATQAKFTELWGNGGRPNAYYFVKGVKAYDPRDPTQDLNDESTWKWTNNATLVEAWYLTRAYGGRIPVSKILWDKIADAADYDDEVIVCGDGSKIRRHTIDGVVTLNERPADVLPRMLRSNRARVLEAGGRVWIDSSRPKSPIAVINDEILAAGIRYEPAKDKSDLINKLQVRMVVPSQNYQLDDGPILDRTDLQEIDGETLTGTLSLDYTLDDSPNCTRVQRLQKLYLESARLGGTLTCAVDAGRLLSIVPDELVGNVVTFDSGLFPQPNGEWLITSVGFSEDFATLHLAMVRYDGSIESSFRADEDEQDFDRAEIDVS